MSAHSHRHVYYSLISSGGRRQTQQRLEKCFLLTRGLRPAAPFHTQHSHTGFLWWHLELDSMPKGFRRWPQSNHFHYISSSGGLPSRFRSKGILSVVQSSECSQTSRNGMGWDVKQLLNRELLTDHEMPPYMPKCLLGTWARVHGLISPGKLHHLYNNTVSSWELNHKGWKLWWIPV